MFLDSCVLIEGLLAPWSSSRGVLILGRSALFTFVLAEIVVQETERVLGSRMGAQYGGSPRLTDDYHLLLRRLNVETVPNVSREEFQEAKKWIRHLNDIPVIAAAVKAEPDWLLTDNTKHFDEGVSARTGLRIATPAEFLKDSGRIFFR